MDIVDKEANTNRMEVSRTGFLADLTTSEGQLHRFTGICHIMRPEGLMETDMLVPLIQKELGLTNVKVIKRHLRAMESLGLVTRENGGYVLSSEGKALCALVPAKSNKTLELAEKVFYFRALALYLPLQFSSALGAISQNAGGPIERVITSYGQRVLSNSTCSTWEDKAYLSLHFSRQPDSPPRKVRNNFDCFRFWLQQLGLVNPQRLQLTSMAQKLLGLFSKEGAELQEKIYWAASAYVGDAPGCLPDFRYEHKPSRARFLELFRKAYALFERPQLRLSDVRSISVYVCMSLLIERYCVLEEKTLRRLIRRLANEGIVQSAIAGRDGKLSYISLDSGPRYGKTSRF